MQSLYMLNYNNTRVISTNNILLWEQAKKENAEFAELVEKKKVEKHVQERKRKRGDAVESVNEGTINLANAGTVRCNVVSLALSTGRILPPKCVYNTQW